MIGARSWGRSWATTHAPSTGATASDLSDVIKPGSYKTIALDISNRGQITRYYFDAEFNFRSYVLQNGVVTLVEGLYQPTAINDCNQIVRTRH